MPGSLKTSWKARRSPFPRIIPVGLTDGVPVGRLGRTGVTRENAELTYWFQPEEYWGKPIDINKEISKIKSERVNNIISIRKEENTKVMDYDLRTPSSKDDKRRTKHRIEKAWHSI